MIYILNLIMVPVASFMAYDAFTSTADVGVVFGWVLVSLAILNGLIGTVGLVKFGIK